MIGAPTYALSKLYDAYSSMPSQQAITRAYNAGLMRKRKPSRSTVKAASEVATKQYVKRVVAVNRPLRMYGVYNTATNMQPSLGIYYLDVADNISAGDGVGQRTGDQIEMVKLRIHGHFWNYNSNHTEGGQIRMVLVRAKRPTETLTTDFYESFTSDATPANFSTNERGSMTRNLNSNKFTVIWDKNIPLPPNFAGAVANTGRYKNVWCSGVQHLNYNIPFKRKIKFEDGNEVAPVYKLMWWVITEDHAGAAADFPASTVGYQFYCDQYFKD